MEARTKWGDAKKAELTELFHAGLSYAGIARAMQLSKNAISNACDRFGLVRGSPIKRRAPEPAHMRCGKPRPIGVVSELTGAPEPARGKDAQARAPSAASVQSTPAYAAPASTCQWIESRTGPASYRFCDAATKRGSSYCPHHHGICWIKPAVPDKRIAA